MPAKRIPWFKVWVGATRHAKIVTLGDRPFRVWVELLDAASVQKVRGRFESYAAAAAIVRRKEADVRQVAAVGLMTEADGGVWMHDWKDWQRWRPEDALNVDGSTLDEHTNDTRTTTDEHTNVNGSTREDPSRGAEGAKKEKGEGRRKTEDERPEDGPPGVPPFVSTVVREPVPKPALRSTAVGMLLDKIKALDPTLEVYGDQGFTGSKLKQNPDADLDLIAEAYVSFRHGEWQGSKMLRESGAVAWVIGDLGGYIGWRNGRTQTRPPGNQAARDDMARKFAHIKDANE